jgi:hypothetical protein
MEKKFEDKWVNGSSLAYNITLNKKNITVRDAKEKGWFCRFRRTSWCETAL